MANRVILPDVIRSMTSDMKTQFESYQTAFEEISTYLQSVIDNEKFKGETAAGMKSQMADHLSIINGINCFLANGISDCAVLDAEAGFEDLYEEQILADIKSAQESIAFYQGEIDYLQKRLQSFWYSLFFGGTAYQLIGEYTLAISQKEAIIERLQRKLEKIEQIDANTRTLFSATNMWKIHYAVEALGKAYSNGDFHPVGSGDIKALGEMKPGTDPRGKRVAGVTDEFIEVDDGSTIWYGGDQGWFASYGANVEGQGCGIMAAINSYLYLTGQTHVTKEYYMSLVDTYLALNPQMGFMLDEHEIPFSGGKTFAIGALPADMAAFVEYMCRQDGLKVDMSWNGKNGIDNNYVRMQEMLNNGTPVIWALHDNNGSDGDSYRLYEFDSKTNTYKGGVNCSSHYVTVTAIFETDDGRRMVEVSSYGKAYYVDYDEYLAVQAEEGIDGVVNDYCSNIMNVEVK